MHAIQVHAHISKGTHMHSCEHRYIPHPPHTLCTCIAHKCLHDGRMYRYYLQSARYAYTHHVQTLHNAHRHTEFTHNGHTHAHRSLSCIHRHTCIHTHHIHNLMHPCMPNPQLQVYTQFCLPLPSPLLPAHPPLPVPISSAILTLWLFTGQSPTSPSWRVRCRWDLLTVFCASSLPFFCFLGWRS